MEGLDNRKEQRVEDLTDLLVSSVKNGSWITCPQKYTQKEKNHFYSLKKAARSCLQKLMDYKPGFEPDQDVSKKLTRAAFYLAYNQCNAKFNPSEKMYTEFELRQAIFTAVTNPNIYGSSSSSSSAEIKEECSQYGCPRIINSTSSASLRTSSTRSASLRFSSH